MDSGVVIFSMINVTGIEVCYVTNERTNRNENNKHKVNKSRIENKMNTKIYVKNP